MTIRAAQSAAVASRSDTHDKEHPCESLKHKFFDMFDETTAILVKAAEEFSALAEHFDHRERRVSDLRELEHQCDLLVEKILKVLDRTCITPIDGEDFTRWPRAWTTCSTTWRGRRFGSLLSVSTSPRPRR
jgi:hypothetical protein